MDMQHIALSNLSISKANMRNGKKPPDISRILPSVRKRGVIIPVIVRPQSCSGHVEGCAPDHFEIMAGRRRYFAALAVEAEGQEGVTLPCAILADGDDADAFELSMIENCLRENPDEVTQWEGYTRLVKEGRTPEDIALTFGLTDVTVKRILALGNLLPRIREAYRAEEIDVPTVRHLTLASKAQQKAWLALFQDADSYAPRGSQLKAWLFGGASIAVSAALFDVTSYQGQIITDLFEDNGYFADADQFWAAQSAEIATRQAQYAEAGWRSAEIVPPEQYFHSWEYEHVSKRKGGRVYIDVKATGEVIFHEGYLTRKEAARNRSADDSEGKATPAPRPEITSPMADYLNLHRHAAVRSVLATNRSVALRVMVAHAICGSPLWQVKVADQRSHNEATTQSVATSVAETQLGERRREILATLRFDSEEAFITQGHDRTAGITGVLQTLLSLPDETVMEVLAIVMAETLAPATELIEHLGQHLGVDMADYWTADPAFFTLLRDRKVITALLADIGGEALANAHMREKASVIKCLIGDCVTGANGRTKKERWVPRWMQFPPSAYTEREGVATVSAARRLRWIADNEAGDSPDTHTAEADVWNEADSDNSAALPQLAQAG